MVVSPTRGDCAFALRANSVAARVNVIRLRIIQYHLVCNILKLVYNKPVFSYFF